MSIDGPSIRTGGVVLHPTAYNMAEATGKRSIVGRLLAWANEHSGWLLAGMIAFYIVVFSILACLKLAWFRQGFDMAGNEQTIWNTLHGRPFRISVFEMMDYDFDDGPVLLQLPLALLYGVYQSPYTLLVLQTIALGIAAWPLYLLGRDTFGVPWQALGLVAIYLLHPTTQHINMYEFQLRAFMIPFALGALLFLERGQFWPYALMLLLMMSTKTEAGFTLMLFRPPMRCGCAAAGCSRCSAGRGSGMGRRCAGRDRSTFQPWRLHHRDVYKALGDNLREVIWNIITDPMLLIRINTQNKTNRS